jgi:hypothetical protein
MIGQTESCQCRRVRLLPKAVLGKRLATAVQTASKTAEGGRGKGVDNDLPVMIGSVKKEET